MENKIVKLTENDLQEIIKESVNEILKEYSPWESHYKFKLHNAAKGKNKETDSDDDRNLNVYDTGHKGKASLMAQGMGGEQKQKIARNYGSTIRQARNNFEKNK